MDSLLVAKLLISLVAVATAIGPMKADFNKTHATNPLWTPHARFHVVWQVLTQAGVSLAALALLWLVPGEINIWIAWALTTNWLVTFVITIATMGMYGGSLKDVNGIKPFKFNIGGKVREVDTNVFGATFLALFNLIALILLLH